MTRKLPKSIEDGIRPYGDGNGWRIDVVKGRNPVTGKRNRKTAVVYGSYRSAVEKKRELLAMLGDTMSLKSNITLGDFWGNWYLPDCEQRLRPVTVHGYASHYRQFIAGQLDALKLSEITPLVIRKWLGCIEGDKRRFEAFKLLRQMLTKAVRWDIMDDNPCTHVDRPPKPQDYEPEVLSAGEVPVYLETFRDTPLEACVTLCIACGFRRSEVVALDWEDIQDGVVDVTHAITSVGGMAWDDDPKSRFGNRTVAIPSIFMGRLGEIRSTGPVVKDTEGNRMNPDNVSKLYGKILRKLPEGVKRIPLMNLRHTSLSLFYEATGDLLATSRRGGHSSMSVTSRYYVRPSKAVDRAGADAYGEMLGKVAKEP